MIFKMIVIVVLLACSVFAQWNNWSDAASVREVLKKSAAENKSFYSQFDWYAPRYHGDLTSAFSVSLDAKPFIYGLDFYYASGTYFPQEYKEHNKKNLVKIVKSAWMEYRAIPSFSWHLENPYVSSDFKEMMGCRYRYSAQVPQYPNNHRFVVHEILKGDGEMCGLGNRSGQDNKKTFSNPREWFEQRVLEIAQIINEFVDDDNKPIPFIFRLWHECEDDWMWWGPKSTSVRDYKEFFILTEKLIKKYAQKSEILWGYGLDRFWKNEDFLKWYPGDEYVDIVGYDDYFIGLKGHDLSENIERARFVSNMARSRDKIAALFETANSHESSSSVFFCDFLKKIVQDSATNLSLVQTWSVGEFKTNEQISDRKEFLHDQSIIVWKNSRE